MTSNNYAWVNRRHRHIQMNEIGNGYLLNLIGFVTKGGGYSNHVNPNVIKNLFNEAEVRGLKHDNNLEIAIARFQAKFHNDVMNEIELYKHI